MKQNWIKLKTGLMLLILSLVFTGAVPAAATNPEGYRLLIYYGVPISINNVNSVEGAAAHFARYDHIVLGAGLEEETHHAHRSTGVIIALTRKLHPEVKIYGYIDLGVSTNDYPLSLIQQKTERWKALGADGIFFDDAGYDYGVSRDRLNHAVEAVHQASMSAFLNAWDPDDIMSSEADEKYNPAGEETKVGEGDLYLLESFLEPTDITQSGSPSAFSTIFKRKMDASLGYRSTLGVKLMSISTINYATVSANAVRKFFRMNEAAAGVFSLDGYGIAPEEFSTGDGTHNMERKMPYILNYMDYYSPDVSYTIKYNEQDFASRGFRLHSKEGDHFYNFPETVQNE